MSRENTHPAGYTVLDCDMGHIGTARDGPGRNVAAAVGSPQNPDGDIKGFQPPRELWKDSGSIPITPPPEKPERR
jgi:hypothetical protein